MATKKKQAKRPYTKYDWPAIKSRYISGSETMRQLAEVYGMNLSTLGVRASKEGWEAARRQHRDMIVEETNKQKSKRNILDKLGFDALTESCTDVVVAHVAQVIRKAYVDKTSMDVMELRDAMSTVKQAQEIKYRALGIAPPKQAIEVDVVSSPAQVTREEIIEEIARLEAAGHPLPDHLQDAEA